MLSLVWTFVVHKSPKSKTNFLRRGPYNTKASRHWYRGSYMSAHILLNILNELVKSHKMWGLTSILSLFHNKLNTFNNTRAQMLDSILSFVIKIYFVLPNSGIVFMASSYKAYIQCNRFILYTFICFFSECILGFFRPDWQNFEVNENFMLSWVEIVILLLNKALSLKRRGTHLGLHYQNAYSWVQVYTYCQHKQGVFFLSKKMSNLPLLRRRKSSCVITERKQYIYQGHLSLKSILQYRGTGLDKQKNSA